MLNLQDLIEKAVSHKACEKEIDKIKKYQSFEDASKDSNAPFWCYWYALNVKGKWPEAESIILTSPQYAHNYAENIIQGKWPEAESIILTNPEYAYMYARYVIEGKWPKAESIILTNLHYAFLYAEFVENK